ncbi:MAG: bifunctional (p)ppGpp synthetase/guanosine-3',5'-bis(diphosphate) 3'-pyrophosphohydrolase [Deltaproteobacteria bacterium]|nr:bifunctional (p)ppGpp synthetase/guanosine-3',5'-bis(diphosphate) 3'-pyrophosphohydrolase [Deltaproteobacteria bacterium]
MIRLDAILDQVREYAPDADLGVVRKAWVYASKHHAGQRRKSGEPYFAHPLEVANILAGLRMDTDTIAVAILHDTVEDTPATLEEITDKFSPEIAKMVDGVTKLDKLDFRNPDEHQAENFRKLVFAMARDIRVILVKLADRVHNMRTLEAMRDEKRVRIAQETMDLYAPIANRLGIVTLKGELEDLSFKYLHPQVYAELNAQVAARAPYFDKYIERVQTQLMESLSPHMPEAEVSGRVKRLWSIWQKMQSKQLTFEEVHDLLAFRITVQNIAQCYGSLGVVHGLWAPQSERFKDYIAQPKANGYQSLHTTVVGPEAQRIEVQIRTDEMHSFGEIGIAAHWKYKEGHLALRPEEIEKYTKIRQLLQWAEDIEDSREFLDVLKVDLYADQVYVYTPRGDIRWFPGGATPLDFAYAIHTEVGHHCTGARVNGRMVKLNYKLRSGDTVEILTKPDQQPNKDWLKSAATSRALSKIRQYLRKEERDRSIGVGKSVLDQELRRFKSSLKAVTKQDGLRKALDAFGKRTAEELFAEIGYGRFSVEKVLPLYVGQDVLDAEKARQEQPEKEPTALDTITGIFRKIGRRSGSPVRIDGMDGMLTTFARCCRPLPGDHIVGFITRGKGVTVHRSDCKQALALPRERRLDVEWDVQQKIPHAAMLEIITVDRPMMLAELSKTVGKMNVNITRAEARTTREDRGFITLEVAVSDVNQLRSVMRGIERLQGVISVSRTANL